MRRLLSFLFASIALTNAAVYAAAPAQSSAPSTPFPYALQASTAPIPDREMTAHTGPDVFVTLTRSAFSATDLPTNTEVVTPETFKLIDAQNAGEALSHQTSIETLPIGRTGSLQTVRIRGSSSLQTLVMVDGRPYEGVGLGTPDLSEIPTESIDHIEIIRGGSSALYGPNAIGGVINIITKRAAYPGKPISHVGYENGSYGRQAYRLNFGSRYGPLDFFFYGNQQWESGFRDNSDARGHNIGGNFGLSLGEAGKLLVDASNFRMRAGVPGQAYGSADPSNLTGTTPLLVPNRFNDKDEKLASSPTAIQITETNALRTSYLLPLPMDMLMALRLFGMQRTVDFDDSTDPNALVASSSYRQEQSHGGELQMNLPAGFMVGGNFTHDHETSNDRLTPSNTFSAFVENWGAFVQEAMNFNRLKIIPSIRYDHHSQAGVSTNPRLLVIADLTDYLRFNASAAHSFRAPTIDDLFFVSPFFNGNPNLRPEKAWAFDGGFNVHGDSDSLRLTYFYARVTDLIQTTADFSTVNNIGKARRQGLEVELDNVISSCLRNTANYTFLDNQGVPTGFTDYVPLSFSPHHTFNDTITWAFSKRWRTDFTGRYLANRFSGNNETGTSLGSQFTLDTRLSYQLRQMELYIGANDLLNKRYVEQPGFPLPGRTFFGGFTLKLWE